MKNILIEQDLDEALKASDGTSFRSVTCILYQFAKRNNIPVKIINKNIDKKNYYLVTTNELITPDRTFKSIFNFDSVGSQIAGLFDEGEFDQIRSMLPVEIEIKGINNSTL